MQEYLAFVDEIGRTSQGDYIYRFDFTTNTDVVWGDYFNIAPAILVPTLTPDSNCLSSRAKAIFPREMGIAKKNSCFSMQDCIDGIIAIFFSDVDEDTLEIDGSPLKIMFGETIENVKENLSKLNIELFDVEILNNGDSSELDSIIENGISDDFSDEDNDDYDDF